jgi:CHAT domain-containing protein
VYRADDPRFSGSGKAQPVPDDPRLTRTVRDLDLDQLERLTYSRDEALALAEMVPSDQRLVALDFEASRETALSGILGEFQMVHIAGHGFLNTVHPALSGVVLSLYDDRGLPRDGFIRAHELRELDLSADLVVRSACRTGLGRQLAGEGVLGVTRGLLLAGARQAVVSHWDVDDLATAELMKRFYSAMLRDGLPASASLRRAELSMAADPEWSAPAYWAGFTLHGDWH